MKKKIIVIVSYVVVLLGVVAFAYEEYGTIQAELAPHFKIFVNGTQTTFKDANGKEVVPVVIDGTTYLPVRAVSENADFKVEWDGETNTIWLERPDSQLMVHLQSIAYDSQNNVYIISGKRAKPTGERWQSAANVYEYLEDIDIKLKPTDTVRGLNGEPMVMEALYEFYKLDDTWKFYIGSIYYYADSKGFWIDD